MKLHQLQAFMAAVETGSIRGAARQMNLSQSALTKALRELELDLDVSLIHRSVRGIHLTDDGARLLARAKLIVRQADLARSEIRQMQGVDEGSVSIGVTPLVALTVLPHAVAAFRKKYKNVRLHVVEGLEGITLPGIRQGKLDFGIMIIAGDHVGEDLAFERWFRARNVVAMRESHPQAKARKLCDLVDVEWLATSFGTHGLGTKLMGYFTEAGLPPPERVLRCESVLSALAIVRNSDVVTFMPRGLLDCPELTGIRAVDLASSPPDSSIGIIMRSDVPLSPVAKAFADVLKDKTARWCASPAGKKSCSGLFL
jgi:LysR family transcriptional regulator, regulator of abg operon